jgi:hypothetical protein
MAKTYLKPGDKVTLTAVTFCVGTVMLTDPDIDDNAETLYWHSDDEHYYLVHYEQNCEELLMYYDKDEGPHYFDPKVDPFYDFI